MKSISTMIIGMLLAFVSCEKPEYTKDEDHIRATESKYLTTKVADGNHTLQAELVTQAKRLLPRSRHTSVVFDNRMWIIGGSVNGNPRNDVLWSSNGEVWTTVTSRNTFPPRKDHASVVFNGRMWIFGGRNDSKAYALNDIWSSPNGINWTLENEDADFNPRYSQTVTEFNGSLWLIGGATTEAYQSPAVCCGFNDVWRSDDGVNWTKVYDTSWGNNMVFLHATATVKGKLVVVGGDYFGGGHAIRYSQNGDNWTGINVNPEFLGHQVENIAGELWVTAGKKVIEGQPDPITDEIWYTRNGMDWSEVSVSTNFPAREEHTSLFFNDRLWIIQGIGSKGDLSDVWSFSSPEFSDGIGVITIQQ